MVSRIDAGRVVIGGGRKVRCDVVRKVQGKVGKKEPCDCEGGGSVMGNVEMEESLDAKSALSYLAVERAWSQ